MEEENNSFGEALERLYETCKKGFDTALKYGWWLGFMWGVVSTLSVIHIYWIISRLMVIWGGF